VIVMGVPEEELKKEIERLQNELDELNDQYLRALADFDNYKKRTEGERSRIRSLGRQDVILKILDVVDDFERAFDAIKDDNPVAEGFKSIYQNLLKVLEEFGVKPFESVGEVFDPNFHDAISSVPPSEHPPGTVTKEFQRGYLMDGEVIRPAKVEVVREVDE